MEEFTLKPPPYEDCLTFTLHDKEKRTEASYENFGFVVSSGENFRTLEIILELYFLFVLGTFNEVLPWKNKQEDSDGIFNELNCI